MAERTKFWGVAPTILRMSKDPANFYIGRTLWFSATFLYISVVYVVQTSWLNIKNEFLCHGNISKACVAECYENHFTKPVLGVWYMVGFVFSSIFFIMEFAVFQKIHKQTKNFKKQLLKEQDDNMAVNEDDKDDTIKDEQVTLDLAHEKPLLTMYLIYFLVQMTVQATFLVILFYDQRPLIKNKIWCSTPLCQGPYSCVLLGTQEKIMSITLLGTLSAVIMTFCGIFFLYTINLYLVGNVTVKRLTKF